MKIKTFLLVLLLYCNAVKSQDLFENSMYHSDHWVFNIEAFSVNNDIKIKDAWYGINLQHFPTRPNLYGNNLLSINTHLNFSPDFKIMQFSTGWFFAVGANAIMSKGTNQYNRYY